MIWNVETRRRTLSPEWPSRGVLSRLHQVSFFFVTLVTGHGSSLSLKLSDTRVYGLFRAKVARFVPETWVVNLRKVPQVHALARTAIERRPVSFLIVY